MLPVTSDNFSFQKYGIENGTCWKTTICFIFKTPMKVIDRTKAVTQHFLDKLFKKV